MKLKVSCRFIDNLQSTDSNVNLLQCYGIFLKSLNLTCTKMKNILQPCDDSANQRTLQKPFWTWVGQDTEGFSNIGVSLGCFHYFYTKVCSQMSSGEDLRHVGMSELICVTNL